MKRVSVVLVVLGLVLLGIGFYLLATRTGTTTANAIQQDSDSSHEGNPCTEDSEPQCMQHAIGAACTNVRDGGIPGVCIERYEACVCR